MGGACVVNKRLEKVSPENETTKRERVRKDPGKDESGPRQEEGEWCRAGKEMMWWASSALLLGEQCGHSGGHWWLLGHHRRHA